MGSCNQFCLILHPHRVVVPFPPTFATLNLKNREKTKKGVILRYINPSLGNCPRIKKSHSDRPRTGRFPFFLSFFLVVLLAGSESTIPEITEYKFISLL